VKRIFLIILLCLNSYLFAQDRVASIDTLMSYCYNNGLFNGAVLVAEKGTIIYSKSFGFANLQTKENVQSNYQFRLASAGKQITAMTVMILKERGKLDYDDQLKKYFPELPYDRITIRHLLTHTSGLPDYVKLFDSKWNKIDHSTGKTNYATKHDLFRLLIKHHPPRLFTPGERYQYSNTGYVMLALLTEKVSDIPFHLFLKKNIFEPLKMTSTLLYSPIRNDTLKKRVYGYRPKLDGNGFILVGDHYLNGMEGDGEIYSSVEDFFIWAMTLYSERLVSQFSLNEAFTPVQLNDGSTYNYGFGWGIETTATGKKKVSHHGGWVGFRSGIDREIDEKNIIILLTNTSSPSIWEIRKAISNILNDVPHKIPLIPISQVVAKVILNDGIEPALNKYTELKKNHFDKFNFSYGELNWLGYQLINRNKNDEAVAVFQQNVKTFPKNYNTFNGLAEAYLLIGKKDLAILNFEKSLMLNPNNKNAKKKLQELKE